MILGADDLPDWLPVSRETHAALKQHLALVAKWNPAINLVSQGSLDGGWARHTLDSAQLFSIGAPSGGLWLDVGSGAGFPGLVIAIIAKELSPQLRVALVESDRRKGAFLAEAVRELDLDAKICCERIERLESVGAKVVSVRAVAELDKLLQVVPQHLTKDGTAVFLKGRSYSAELKFAAERWRFDCEVVPSKMEPESVVLKMRNISHV